MVEEQERLLPIANVDREGMVDEQERLLPIANVGRIMKQVLPPSAKISKEAKQRMQECATEFISFVTGEASDKCYKENRKTVNGDDICWALSSLGFDNYAVAMIRYLHKYREHERGKASNKQQHMRKGNRAMTTMSHEENKGDDKNDDGNNDDFLGLSHPRTHHHPQHHPHPAPLEFRIIDKNESST